MDALLLPRHEAYQGTGVPWLGDIPAHWKLKKNKYLFKEKKLTVGKKSSNYTLLSLTLKGVIAINMDNPQGKFPAEFNTYKIVNPNDLIFCLFDIEETPRTIGLAHQHGMITGAYTVMECQSAVSARYLSYYYLYLDTDKKLKPLYTGLRKVIQRDTFMSIKSPLPPNDEQSRIASFLDHKTAEIDEIIAKKQRLIELLKEQKANLVSQVVTKGLNPDAPMRDSGVEWIGEVPEHWKIKRIKHVSVISPSRNIDGVKKSDKIVTFLPMERISEKGTIDVSEKRRIKEVYEGFTYFAEGDVVIAKITPCFENGKGAYLANLDSNFGFGTTELHVLRPKNINGEYLFQLLNSRAFLKLGEEFMVGSAGQKRLPTSFVKNYLFGMPPTEEQHEIAMYCKDVSKKFENMLNLQANEVEKLSEYRQTLISNVVTGKIKI